MKMTTVLNLLVGACIRSWNAISRLSFYGNSPWEQVSSPGLEGELTGGPAFCDFDL